jgi:hypothetical protein
LIIARVNHEVHGVRHTRNASEVAQIFGGLISFPSSNDQAPCGVRTPQLSQERKEMTDPLVLSEAAEADDRPGRDV